MSVVLTDDFSSDNFTNVSLSSWSVSGGEGTAVATGDQFAYQPLGTSISQFELYIEFKIGANDYEPLFGLYDSASDDGYSVQYWDWWPGIWVGRIRDMMWNVEASDSTSGGGGATPSDQIKARVRYDGSTLKVRYWLNSDAEPGTWLESWTESSLTTFDRIFIGGKNGTTATYQYLTVDDLTSGQPLTKRFGGVPYSRGTPRLGNPRHW